MRTGAVIAAAGTPGGFRAYDKLENTDAGVMLRRMIYTFRRAGVERSATDLARGVAEQADGAFNGSLGIPDCGLGKRAESVSECALKE